MFPQVQDSRKLSDSAPGILSGIRVIELAGGIAGPVAGMLLASSGAEVLRIEPSRFVGARYEVGYATWNRGKRSLVIDPATEAGRKRIAGLLRSADVLVHDLTPATAASLELDAGALAERYPALVVSGITAFPVGHAAQEMPASDALVLARSGLMDEQQPVRRDGPTYLRIPLASWGAAYLAATAIVARLIHREATGVGGAAHTSLYQGALVPMTMHWARAATPSPAFAAGMPKDISKLPLMTPSIFQCADGKWFHVMASPDATPLMRQIFQEWGPEGVAEANARHGLAEPHRNFPNWGADQVAFGLHPRQRWLEEMWAHDVPVQPVLPMGAAFFDEQAEVNGYVVEVDDPRFGRVRQAGIPFTIVGHPATIRPAPEVGEADSDDLERPVPAPAPTMAGTKRWPLEGIKVLDFGMYLAGPIAPMLLGDLGAEVIKVEPPSGDYMRFVERTFAGTQRNKRGIALDMKKAESRPVLEALVRWADVVHHNLRLPAARTLGIDEESLRAINPELVYCHVSSYGQTGPQADWPGFDQLFQASSGWETEGAGEGNPPMWHRFGMMDHQGGLASLLATLLGLYQRLRTGEGQSVSASLLGASILTMSETMVLPDGSLAEYPKLDGDQLGIGLTQRLVQVSDGWIVIDAVAEPDIDRLCRALSAADPPEAMARLSDCRMTEALSVLQTASVPAAAVALDQMEAFFNDEEVWRLRLAARYPHPEYGMMEQIGSLWTFEDMQPRLDRACPVLGEHTGEILSELGFTQEDIDDLYSAEAVAGRAACRLRNPPR